MSSTNYLQPERSDNSRAEIQKYFTPDFCLITTDVTQNADDESPAASQAGQPRGDGDYMKKFRFCTGYAHRAQPQTSATAGILSA
jgi:hypothetical protein